MHVDCAGSSEVVISPNPFEELLSSIDPSWVGGHEEEELIFLEAQIYAAPPHGNFVVCGIDRQAIRVNDVISLVGSDINDPTSSQDELARTRRQDYHVRDGDGRIEHRGSVFGH